MSENYQLKEANVKIKLRKCTTAMLVMIHILRNGITVIINNEYLMLVKQLNLHEQFR